MPGDVIIGRPHSTLKFGITTYTTRKLSLDDTINIMKRLELNYMSIKDFHLPLTSTKEQRSEVSKKVSDAGIKLVGCGNIGMKNEADMRNAFEYAHDIG